MFVEFINLLRYFYRFFFVFVDFDDFLLNSQFSSTLSLFQFFARVLFCIFFIDYKFCNFFFYSYFRAIITVAILEAYS